MRTKRDPGTRAGANVSVDHGQPTAREAHRHLAFDGADRVRMWDSFDDDSIDEALRRLDERMTSGDWLRDRYRRTQRIRERPRDLGGAQEIRCDVAELVVVRLLARTFPYNQFSVTPQGDVFAGEQLGYHPEVERFYVTALCPILDDAADLLLWQSGGQGGRMYVHAERRLVERASNRSVLAHLRVDEPRLQADR